MPREYGYVPASLVELATLVPKEHKYIPARIRSIYIKKKHCRLGYYRTKSCSDQGTITCSVGDICGGAKWSTSLGKACDAYNQYISASLAHSTTTTRESSSTIKSLPSLSFFYS